MLSREQRSLKEMHPRGLKRQSGVQKAPDTFKDGERYPALGGEGAAVSVLGSGTVCLTGSVSGTDLALLSCALDFSLSERLLVLFVPGVMVKERGGRATWLSPDIWERPQIQAFTNEVMHIVAEAACEITESKCHNTHILPSL